MMTQGWLTLSTFGTLYSKLRSLSLYFSLFPSFPLFLSSGGISFTKSNFSFLVNMWPRGQTWPCIEVMPQGWLTRRSLKLSIQNSSPSLYLYAAKMSGGSKCLGYLQPRPVTGDLRTGVASLWECATISKTSIFESAQNEFQRKLAYLDHRLGAWQ